MKLVFCLFKYNAFGGLSRDFLAVAKEAVERGHRVRVLTQSWQGARPDALDIELLPVSGFTNHGKSLKFATLCQQKLADSNVDAVIGFNRMMGLDYYFAADLSFIVQAKKGHGPLYRLTARYRAYANLEYAVFAPKVATYIFALTQRQISEYQQQHNTPTSRFTLLPPNVDQTQLEAIKKSFVREDFRQAHGVAADQRLLLMVGSDFKTKGTDRSVRAVAQLPEALKEKIRLVVIGEGDAAAMMSLANQLGIASLITFAGPIENPFEWMLAADLLLHPSRVEAAGNSIVEALCAELPAIVTDNCGFADHVTGADAGALITGKPFDQGQFKHVLENALQESKLEHWRQNASCYTNKTRLYGRPSVMLDTLEQRISNTTQHSKSDQNR